MVVVFSGIVVVFSDIVVVFSDIVVVFSGIVVVFSDVVVVGFAGLVRVVGVSVFCEVFVISVVVLIGAGVKVVILLKFGRGRTLNVMRSTKSSCSESTLSVSPAST